MLGAFHEHPLAACYRPFSIPVQDDVQSYAGRLPDPRAADALYGIGFRTLAVHADPASANTPGSLLNQLRPLLTDPTRVEFVGEGEEVRV